MYHVDLAKNINYFLLLYSVSKVKSTDREVSRKGWHKRSLAAYCQEGWKKDISNSAPSMNMGSRDVQRTDQCHAGTCS